MKLRKHWRVLRIRHESKTKTKKQARVSNPSEKGTEVWEGQPTTRNRGMGCGQCKAYLPDNEEATASPLISGSHKANIEGMVMGLGLSAMRSIPHCPLLYPPIWGSYPLQTAFL